MIDKFLYNFFSYIDNFFEALDKLFKRLHNRCHERYKNIRKLFKKSKRRKSKKLLFKNLRTEVNTGANGTQDYIIKKGTNIGKVAKK
jgi:hypothetical protein